ncbi:ABC transporter substrate-binding protein [Corynebacterium belfantii]|uniref:ABC transporter substrate-binding protein n=1 Tax=Corynebacterium belfantii TaxID=2014537 RepID=UPI0018D2C2BA|nr:ABC transporter substrate-binding protein [Corynebacterium belfantii]MBG9328149.1 ABC transporter substrate-binding protein [Corynebacterium belfantii]
MAPPEDTSPAASAQQLTVTDINGRESTFDKEPQRVVAAGPRTLRMLTYLQITESWWASNRSTTTAK